MTFFQAKRKKEKLKKETNKRQAPRRGKGGAGDWEREGKEIGELNDYSRYIGRCRSPETGSMVILLETLTSRSDGCGKHLAQEGSTDAYHKHQTVGTVCSTIVNNRSWLQYLSQLQKIISVL